MISKEAKAISDEFARLRDYGAIVFNFNTYRKMQRSMKGFCDHFIFTRKAVYFIETKLLSTKDKFSEDQKRLKRIIQII